MNLKQIGFFLGFQGRLYPFDFAQSGIKIRKKNIKTNRNVNTDFEFSGGGGFHYIA